MNTVTRLLSSTAIVVSRPSIVASDAIIVYTGN